VPELDRAEAAAIGAVFGPGGVPVTAPKTMTGRLYSGGAPLDLAAALLTIRDGLIPPTANVVPAPEYDLDLVLAPRPKQVDTALVLARGSGGFNSAMVIRSPDQERRKG
jgi:minimal PKS chain-length factor (CLF/KS beta)